MSDLLIEKLNNKIDQYTDIKIDENSFSAPDAMTTVLARRGQALLRKRLFKIYDSSCAFCGFNIEQFLVVSHIREYADDKDNRLNPRNAVLLCKLCDVAFELGYIIVPSSLEIKRSKELINRLINPAVNSWLKSIRKKIKVTDDYWMPSSNLLQVKTSRSRFTFD